MPASLHPLSLACIEVGDGLLHELLTEVAISACAATATPAAAPAEIEALAEGVGVGPALPERLVALLQVEARELRRAAGANAGGGGGAGTDVFGNRPKGQAAEVVTCMNCGAQVAANRFAPHLDKCMLGKGRAASRKANESLRETDGRRGASPHQFQ